MKDKKHKNESFEEALYRKIMKRVEYDNYVIECLMWGTKPMTLKEFNERKDR